MHKIYHDNTWDFKTANTKILTHCFHPYPAMMIPQIAGRLIEKFGRDAKILFDPYCGTGTSLVEANIRGINSIGTDINPLARLISKAKTTPIKKQILDLHLKDFNDYIFQYKFGIRKNGNLVTPDFKNIEFWFTGEAVEKLAIVKEYIKNIEHPMVRQFFKVAFSETIRDCSLTRKGEFKLFRMSENQIRKFNPDVFGIIETKLARNRDGLLEFMNICKGNAKTAVYDFNTVKEIPPNYLKENFVDIILTSPPYGDSRTTVAYGQFSRLANQWMGYLQAHSLDSEMMGGRRRIEVFNGNSKALYEIILKISGKDENRVKDVISFYKDYKSSIDNISKIIKPGGYVCYVVGNRRVKGETIPTDIITADFYKQNNFEHIETIVRNIPNKRMPSKNSPTNEIGKKDETMTKEYIVVLQKKYS